MFYEDFLLESFGWNEMHIPSLIKLVILNFLLIALFYQRLLGASYLLLILITIFLSSLTNGGDSCNLCSPQLPSQNMPVNRLLIIQYLKFQGRQLSCRLVAVQLTNQKKESEISISCGQLETSEIVNRKKRKKEKEIEVPSYQEKVKTLEINNEYKERSKEEAR